MGSYASDKWTVKICKTKEEATEFLAKHGGVFVNVAEIVEDMRLGGLVPENEKQKELTKIYGLVATPTS